jgi:hypothetical protein
LQDCGAFVFLELAVKQVRVFKAMLYNHKGDKRYFSFYLAALSQLETCPAELLRFGQGA